MLPRYSPPPSPAGSLRPWAAHVPPPSGRPAAPLRLLKKRGGDEPGGSAGRVVLHRQRRGHRSKDVIISGGENVNSGEVESVLYGHPMVNEVAVVAQPDKFWGETPCVFISRREEVEALPTETEVISWCRGRMPHYMVPKTVVFKPELLKTSTGKI